MGIVMITRTNSKITVNGTERLVNVEELKCLSKKYLPSGVASKHIDEFVDEVIFRIADLKFDNIDTNGKSIEEYYFAACLCYAEENGFTKFFEEEDDGRIFECCGAELR